MGANDSRGVANLDPRDMIGRSTTKYCYILNIQTLGLVVSEKVLNFHVFLIISLWQIMTPPGRGHFGPQGHGWHDV